MRKEGAYLAREGAGLAAVMARSDPLPRLDPCSLGLIHLHGSTQTCASHVAGTVL